MNRKTVGAILGVIGIIASCVYFVVLMFYLTQSQPTSETFTMLGRHDVVSRVYYQENIFFPEGEINENSFLLSFTESIALESNLHLNFSEQTYIICTFEVIERFSITSLVGGVNTTVFRQELQRTLVSSSKNAEYFSFISEKFYIDPWEYHRIFTRFLNTHRNQILFTEGAIIGAPIFQAELVLIFIYDLVIPDERLNERTQRIVHIPISQELFSLHATGATGINIVNELVVDSAQPSLVTTGFAFAIIAIGITTILVKAVSMLTQSPHQSNREVDKNVKKYRELIAELREPILDIESLKQANVRDFEELVNISMIRDKHITFVRGNGKAEFSVFDEPFVYRFETDYFEDSDLKIVSSDDSVTTDDNDDV